MLIQPPNTEDVSRNLRRERRLWHDDAQNTPSLGCINCPDKGLAAASASTMRFMTVSVSAAANRATATESARNAPKPSRAPCAKSAVSASRTFRARRHSRFRHCKRPCGAAVGCAGVSSRSKSARYNVSFRISSPAMLFKSACRSVRIPFACAYISVIMRRASSLII